MSSTLELVALKLAGPGAAVVVAIAAIAGGEVAGFDVGAAELGGAAIALFMLREVFGFVRWNSERKAPAPAADEQRLEVQREIVDCLKRQTEILKCMQSDQAVILEITKDYDKNGRCPFTNPDKRESTIRAIGREARRSGDAESDD